MPSTAPDLDPETDRRTRELQGEIAHTRAELSETIEAIQDRLRPSNIASDARERVKAATTEKVKNMAETASDTAQGMMRETRDRAMNLVDGAKQNPIPALMIGAGIAWLLIDRARGEDDYSRPSGRGRQSSGYPDYQADSYSGAGYRGSGYGESDDARRRSAYEESEGLTVRAREVADEAKRSARRTQNALQRMLRQNPLLVGAAAVLAGAAVGASLPETERENEWMGETRDNVLDKAQEAARTATETVREVAGDTVGDTLGKVARAVVSKDA
jgi:ElaB/YqjD/DUF883 family membrane-anchored ribosome-binding protein